MRNKKHICIYANAEHIHVHILNSTNTYLVTMHCWVMPWDHHCLNQHGGCKPASTCPRHDGALDARNKAYSPFKSSVQPSYCQAKVFGRLPAAELACIKSMGWQDMPSAMTCDTIVAIVAISFVSL